jgi:hypothetical protein
MNQLKENGIISQAIVGLVEYANLQNVKIHNEQKSPYVINAGSEQDTTNFTSKLGTPVYSNVIFNAGKQFDQNMNEINNWSDFRIDDCLISISQAKKIVTTEIQGRDGTVKEYIGMDDFQVQIVGRLNGSYGVNPKSDTKILKTILDAGQPLAITSWWLQNLGITDIVVVNYDLGQIEGEYSTQYFTINAISDKIVEARILG